MHKLKANSIINSEDELCKGENSWSPLLALALILALRIVRIIFFNNNRMGGHLCRAISFLQYLREAPSYSQHWPMYMQALCTGQGINMLKVQPFSRGLTIVAFRQANETIELGDYSKPCFVSRAEYHDRGEFYTRGLLLKITSCITWNTKLPAIYRWPDCWNQRRATNYYWLKTKLDTIRHVISFDFVLNGSKWLGFCIYCNLWFMYASLLNDLEFKQSEQTSNISLIEKHLTQIA